MDLGLRDRVAIVTGGSKDWPGRSRGAGDEGAAVVVATAKSVTEAERVVRGLLDKGGRAVSIQADVSRAEDVQRLVQTTVKTFGRLDILVNNAARRAPPQQAAGGHARGTVDFMIGNHLRSAFCVSSTRRHT